MQISSEFCRAQEAQQNERAENSPLGNVKTIALGAAAAWRTEAVAAERRERRRSNETAETAAVELPTDEEQPA